jgi:Asp-tRNA(Asn)/Glu-tRNA(Gln) amidotransferase A subunit family amidase
MSGAVDLLPKASVEEVADFIRSQTVTSTEVTRACLERIRALDGAHHAFITVLEEDALAAAAQADDDVRCGRPIGPLHGVPVSVKDAFLLRGTPTTVGAAVLRAHAPAEDDAACLDRLRDAGAVLLGKVNVGSGIAWQATALSCGRLPPAENPWRRGHTPGGSSSGSAVAVTLGMGYASIGTDSGGSVRNPAALSGVVGLKPTFGRVSQRGCVYGLCRSFEHIGPLTRTVRDAAILLHCLAGYDTQDPTSADIAVPDYLNALAPTPPETLHVGWCSDGGPLGAEADVLERVAGAVRVLRDLGMLVEELPSPAADPALWYELTLLEEAAAFNKMLPTLPAYPEYARANLLRKRERVSRAAAARAAAIQRSYAALFSRYDLLVLPTAPLTAKPLTMPTLRWNDDTRDTLDLHLANTWVFNLTGHPAISVPCGFDRDRLPVGIQLVARHFDEARLLQAAARYEATIGRFPLPPLVSAPVAPPTDQP